ncbi:hypothetical protein [Phytohabitans suffuscus]|uniref:Uncharacterized protein n=1 Tax=Phytohabitans suffuscus TaxID=624315 RepID=A0A6F8YIZ0_9ACTN|nr:hypothetical protein [Phytohabitans suffuscus]BCB86072.1 hypothetical protein Psuf_033850 [Phytohabitans suffuscus]
MSEYQYYEFIAVDRPLTETQQGELRALSTRARITPSSFVNDYQWGDLKGDPRTWMERYFDAFLYLANWGTHRIALRLPLGVLDAKTAADYCTGDSAHSWVTRTHVILDLSTQDEGGDEWWDDQDRLASIVPVRAELASGDRRLLYLAWLLCVQGRELDDEEPEPPIPPGLGDLSGPLRALGDFLRLDPDLLAAAAEASPPLKPDAPSAAALGRWVRQLPEGDKDAALLRLLRGEEVQVRAELLRRFSGPATQHTGSGRTAGELLTAAEARWAERQRIASERQAAERRRQEQLAAAARQKRLDELAGRQAQAWQRVAAMIETKKPKEYDAAIVLLKDLRALAERDGDTATFNRQIWQLRQQHIRKPSLIDRLDRAALV